MIVGPSYQLTERRADVQRCVNLMPTPTEAAGGKSPMYLAPVPGLRAFGGGIPAPNISDVGFVYTSESGDDTAFQLEIPEHAPGDTILVVARGTNYANVPDVMTVQNAVGTNLLTLTSLSSGAYEYANGLRFMFGILPANAYQVYGSLNTVQVGIHVYRGAITFGDVTFTEETLSATGAEIPAISLTQADGSSRVWCGVSFNQPKIDGSTPSTPSGLTKRLTSPPPLGGGTLVTYDTTEGVQTFDGETISASGGAYYIAWAVEMVAA